MDFDTELENSGHDCRQLNFCKILGVSVQSQLSSSDDKCFFGETKKSPGLSDSHIAILKAHFDPRESDL